jgi:hypothetical protein
LRRRPKHKSEGETEASEALRLHQALLTEANCHQGRRSGTCDTTASMREVGSSEDRHSWAGEGGACVLCVRARVHGFVCAGARAPVRNGVDIFKGTAFCPSYRSAAGARSYIARTHTGMHAPQETEYIKCFFLLESHRDLDRGGSRSASPEAACSPLAASASLSGRLLSPPPPPPQPWPRQGSTSPVLEQRV